MTLHRVQVEQELRTRLLKLRQQFRHGAGNQQELGAILAKSFSSTLPLLRHTLIAFQEQPANAPADVFARVAALTAASAPAFEAQQRLREPDSLDRDAAPPVHGGYLAALDKVSEALGQHLPERRSRRSG